MRPCVLPNKALRLLDVSKLRLSSQLREVLILFSELYEVPIGEQLNFITSTYNNATFQLHVPASIMKAAAVARIEMWLEIDQNYCLTLNTQPQLSVKLFEHYKFAPICEYFQDCCIAQNNYQLVLKVKNNDPVMSKQDLAISSQICYISAYHQQHFQLSAQYILNPEQLQQAPFWEPNFLDNERKIGRLLKEVQTDGQPIGLEVDKFLDIVGLDRLTFCYSQRDMEADLVKKPSYSKIDFVVVNGGLEAFAYYLLGAGSCKDDDI